MLNSKNEEEREEHVRLPIAGGALEGDLVIPEHARGLVLFAHGSGSSRRSSRNRAVARTLRAHGLGTLLFDLLTADEEKQDAIDARLRSWLLTGSSLARSRSSRRALKRRRE